MYSTFLVSKDECMDCNNRVLKQLGTLQGVFEVELDRIEGRVVVTHTDEVTREKIAEALAERGFLEIKQDEEIETDEPSIWGCAL